MPVNLSELPSNRLQLIKQTYRNLVLKGKKRNPFLIVPADSYL